MTESQPLADRLRPTSLERVVGQGHILGKNSLIQQAIKTDKPQSIILWGPPGSGKTTIARLYAQAFKARFEPLSAVLAGVGDVREVVRRARENLNLNERTVLFVDEVHRFNKAQQDAFLPHVENGTLVFIGATTENPSFALNNALLSRAQVLEVKALTTEALEQILTYAEEQVGSLPLDRKARQALLEMAQGDGRMLLNYVEVLSSYQGTKKLDIPTLQGFIHARAAVYDRAGEGHYNLVSALHKSIRGSDPDAALYWLSRMLVGGEDPLFIARRLIRTAAEDIGLADPAALVQAMAARDAYQMLGSPEGEIALAQCTIYLALAPKSNALYVGFNEAWDLAKKEGHLPPPKHILNAPTQTMKELDYANHYVYDHDTPHAFSGQHYFPTDTRPSFYRPPARGFEREMQKRLDYFSKLRHKLRHG
jgi:putative ATPase